MHQNIIERMMAYCPIAPYGTNFSEIKLIYGENIL